MSKNKEKNEEKQKEKELKEYLEGNAKGESLSYFVKDCFVVDKADVRTLFIVESPHIEEMKDKKPNFNTNNYNITYDENGGVYVADEVYT